jgi:hypothetical protein
MGWTRSTLLLLGGWAMLAGANCSDEESDSTCDELYSNVAGYQLCEQKPSSCVFYRNNRQEAEISCGAICVSRGAICLSAYNEGDLNVCDVGDELTCDAPPCDETSCQVVAADAVCECGSPSNGGTGGAAGSGGVGGAGGSRTLSQRCNESDEFYCENGYACRSAWFTSGAVSPEVFEQFYGQDEDECLSTGVPCTTEEAYCGERGFDGTYDAANHEVCISGQNPATWDCPVDPSSGLPVFPPECDEICVVN